MREASLSVVCGAGPLKTGSSKHFSARVRVRSGYTTTVLTSLWACVKNSARVNSISPVVKPIIELKGNVDMVRFGLPQLKAQLQLTRSQILSNKLSSVSTKSGEENGSWQLVKKKLHCERHCSQHGATQTTEARVRSTASLVTSNEPEIRLKWLVPGECGKC